MIFLVKDTSYLARNDAAVLKLRKDSPFKIQTTCNTNNNLIHNPTHLLHSRINHLSLNLKERETQSFKMRGTHPSQPHRALAPDTSRSGTRLQLV